MDKKIHDMEIIATSRALTPAEFNTLKQMLRILTLNNIELMLLDNGMYLGIIQVFLKANFHVLFVLYFFSRRE